MVGTILAYSTYLSMMLCQPLAAPIYYATFLSRFFSIPTFTLSNMLSANARLASTFRTFESSLKTKLFVTTYHI